MVLERGCLKCVEMEKQFIAEYERQGKEAYGTANHILSKEIQDRALLLKDRFFFIFGKC